nr:protein kinase-like domain, Concanavalin A-like lectin/glucanase domain protein [Ipomoea batatas]
MNVLPLFGLLGGKLEIYLLLLSFSSRLGWCSVYLSTRSKRMHWMDARALRRKDALRGERPWGDTVCDPWISDRETVSKLRG